MGVFESLKRSLRNRGPEATIKRLGENFFPDMGHMFSAPSATVYEDIPEYGRIAVIDRLMNRTEKRNGQAELWEAVSTLAPGTYATGDRVGHVSEGTSHLHFFIVDRTEDGATLLFVDSEAYINQGKRQKGQLLREGDLRPQVCNLMAVHMKDAETQPDIAMTRFRTEKIKNPADLSFDALLQVTRNLFRNKGIPPALAELQNEEVVFRLMLSSSTSTPLLVQTRDTNDVAGLRLFLQGRSLGSPMLRGQVRSAAALLTGEFPAHINRGDLTLRPALTPKDT
jgi:hypothetical protein